MRARAFAFVYNGAGALVGRGAAALVMGRQAPRADRGGVRGRGRGQRGSRLAIFKYGFRFHCCISSAFMKLMSSALPRQQKRG